jgi:hypothetical protein
MPSKAKTALAVKERMQAMPTPAIDWNSIFDGPFNEVLEFILPKIRSGGEWITFSVTDYAVHVS